MTGFHKLNTSARKEQAFNVQSGLSGHIFKWNIGDGIPTHKHPLGECHITICTAGQLKIEFPTALVVLNPGDVYDIEPDVDHSLTAMTDGTCVINLRRERGSVDPHENVPTHQPEPAPHIPDETITI